MDGIGRRGLMVLRNVLLIFGLGIYVLGCAQSTETPDQTTAQAKPSPVDAKFANAFAALDGVWSGEFIIYEHNKAQKYRDKIPDKLDYSFLESLDLQEVDRIQVNQVYTSETPYYQRVNITDTYSDGDEIKTVVSTGVNKVENGKLWCVVMKPSEKIVHEGSIPTDDVIVWQGFNQNPLRKEYFYETVLTDTYEIVGYGYYDDDNTKKNPRYWFYGKYDRVK